MSIVVVLVVGVSSTKLKFQLHLSHSKHLLLLHISKHKESDNCLDVKLRILENNNGLKHCCKFSEMITFTSHT